MPATNSFLFVRSADRALGTSSAYRVTLPQSYANVSAVTLLSAEVPYSCYNLDAPNTAGVTFTHNGVAYAYSVAPGFYQITDLTANILASLQSAFPTAGVTSVSYSTSSGFISVVYTSGLAFSVQGTSAGSLGRIMGTDPAGVATLASGGVLTLPSVATLAPTSTLFMRVAELPSLMASTNQQQAFARLQLSGAPGSIVLANAATSVFNTNTYASPVASLATLTVSLYTQDGVPANLHGVEWTFTLLISHT